MLRTLFCTISLGRHPGTPSAHRTRTRGVTTTMPTDPRATLRAGLPDRYLTPEDLAALLSVPIETVYHWRKRRTGPPGFRIGRHIRYDPAVVRDWITEQAARDAA